MKIDFQENEVMPLLHGALQLYFLVTIFSLHVKYSWERAMHFKKLRNLLK